MTVETIVSIPIGKSGPFSLRQPRPCLLAYRVSIPIGKSGPFSRSTETRLLRKSYRFQSPSGSQALLAGVTITRGVITGVAFQSPSGSQALLARAGQEATSTHKGCFNPHREVRPF